jgi:ribosome-binding ATPase YchF (GTP1/OBG family)
VMYVCNVDESAATTGNAYVEQMSEAVKDEQAEVLVLAVGTEADINELGRLRRAPNVFGRHWSWMNQVRQN